MQGLISQAASQLLHSVNMQEKTGSVTFSWYRIDCSMPEVVTDILKAASSTAQGLVSSKQSATDTASLMLREAGKGELFVLRISLGKLCSNLCIVGRGMIVPGLWEVEIANGNDIEAVIQHVVKMVPSADHSTATGHSVMVLTCKNPSHGNAKHSASSSGRNKSICSTMEWCMYLISEDCVLDKSTVLGDPPGLGRLTFVMLGGLSPSTAGSSVSGFYPWVDQVHTLAGWLAARRPSPPFHKSRLLLLLRDAFLHKQSLSSLLLLSPVQEDHAINTQWLRIMQAICGSATASAAAASNPNLAAYSTDPAGRYICIYFQNVPSANTALFRRSQKKHVNGKDDYAHPVNSWSKLHCRL